MTIWWVPSLWQNVIPPLKKILAAPLNYLTYLDISRRFHLKITSIGLCHQCWSNHSIQVQKSIFQLLQLKTKEPGTICKTSEVSTSYIKLWKRWSETVLNIKQNQKDSQMWNFGNILVNILRLSRVSFPFYWLWRRKSNFGARLQAIKPDMTHITLCRNVISIKHTANDVFVVLFVFGLFFRLEEGRI